jgi:hypothetical protein
LGFPSEVLIRWHSLSRFAPDLFLSFVARGGHVDRSSWFGSSRLLAVAVRFLHRALHDLPPSPAGSPRSSDLPPRIPPKRSAASTVPLVCPRRNATFCQRRSAGFVKHAVVPSGSHLMPKRAMNGPADLTGGLEMLCISPGRLSWGLPPLHRHTQEMLLSLAPKSALGFPSSWFVHHLDGSTIPCAAGLLHPAASHGVRRVFRSSVLNDRSR